MNEKNKDDEHEYWFEVVVDQQQKGMNTNQKACIKNLQKKKIE